MQSSQINAYKEFYRTYVWKLEDEVKRHANLVALLEQQDRPSGKEHIMKGLEIAKARLETCETIDLHARREIERVEAYAREVEMRMAAATESGAAANPNAEIFHKNAAKQAPPDNASCTVLPQTQDDPPAKKSRTKRLAVVAEGAEPRHTRRNTKIATKTPTNGIDLLLAADAYDALVPPGEQRTSVTRASDGVVFEVQQRVSFLDPKSRFYVDGVVAAILGPHHVEVGYWGSRWSDSEYNHVVHIDTLLRISRIKAKGKVTPRCIS